MSVEGGVISSFNSLEQAIEHRDRCVELAKAMLRTIEQLIARPDGIVVASPTDGEPLRIRSDGYLGVAGEVFFFPADALHATQVCIRMNKRWPGAHEVMTAEQAARLHADWYALFRRMCDETGVDLGDVETSGPNLAPPDPHEYS